MAAEIDAGAGRAPACLCVLCGLPAAGKSSLARTILGTAAQHGWRAAVVPYDDLIPEHAFQTRVVEDGAKVQETVKAQMSHVITRYPKLEEGNACYFKCTFPLSVTVNNEYDVMLLTQGAF